MALKASELRKMDDTELAVRIAEIQKEVYDIRHKQVTKEDPNTSRIKLLRRDLARIKTVMNERHRGEAAAQQGS